jgi:hypothetical protein
VYAAVVIGFGVLGVFKPGFTPLWDPDLPGRTALLYLCAAVSLGTGVGLLWRSAAAARLLLAYLLAWLLVFPVRELVGAPDLFLGSFACAELAAIAAGAWVLYVWFATDWDRRNLGFIAGNGGLRIARVLYGLSLIPFGVAHFIYIERTISLVPDFLPAPGFWARATAITFLAAAAAIVTGVCARLAAALSAIQIGAFLVLVWIPQLSAGLVDTFEWGEIVVTTALAAAGWLVAESYRPRR